MVGRIQHRIRKAYQPTKAMNSLNSLSSRVVVVSWYGVVGVWIVEGGGGLIIIVVSVGDGEKVGGGEMEGDKEVSGWEIVCVVLIKSCTLDVKGSSV